MVSVWDIQEVDIDDDDRTFTIMRNSGKVQTYKIDDEYDFFRNILINADKFDVYVLSSENVDESAMRYYEEYRG